MWAASAASLNALGAVAGTGVSEIFGILDLCFLGMIPFGEAIREDGTIDGAGNDGKAVVGKDAGG